MIAIVSFGLLVNGPGRAAPDGNTSQRAVLYDEDPSDPKGKMYYGSVVWRSVPDAAGQADDFLAVADVDIPLRKLKMTLSFRRNNDKSLPASHVAELKFVLPPDFAGGGVGQLPGKLMKVNEQSRGSPLAAQSVKVTDGFFMVGLSDVETERARNLELLERAWFDIPMVYFSGRRAILALEKGPPGTDALKAVFGTRSQPPAPVTSSSLRTYGVQVSAQDNEAAALAAYQVLQTKFSAVLGTRKPTIKRVDSIGGGLCLTMVGPFATADEAFDLCESLKAAGGECIVQRN